MSGVGGIHHAVYLSPSAANISIRSFAFSALRWFASRSDIHALPAWRCYFSNT